MVRFYGVAIALGLVSGALNLSVLSGSPAAIALNFFSALPLFIAGLGIGTPTAVIGGLTGSVMALVVAGPLATAAYLVGVAVPAVFLSREAILARDDGKGEHGSGGLEWYPLGQLVAWVSALALAYLAVALIAAAVEGGGLIGEISQTLRSMLTAPPSPEGAANEGEISRQVLEMQIQAIARLAPAMMAAVWILGLSLNGALAQEILRRLGRNIRPKADIAELALPRWFALTLVAAPLAAMLPGSLGVFGIAATGCVLVAYFLQGLAVIHAVARKFRAREMFLIGAYFVILIISWPIILVIAAGILEQWFGFRQKAMAQGGESNQKEE